MTEKYNLIESFPGYKTKADKTHIEPGWLVSPSQNVLINDAEKVQIRGGYELHGAASTDNDAIEGSKRWDTSSNSAILLRSHGSSLQIYTSGLGAWTDLMTSLTNVDFIFDTWWSSSEGIDLLLFVDGTDSIFEWSGGIAEISATTSNTIKKTGTATWAEARFLTAGTRKVTINGTEYTYTGGESTTTLTGVTADPTGEADGSTVIQTVRENTDKPAANFLNDVIRVLDNHVYLSSNTSKSLYISKNTDFTSFTYSSPRVPGEGALLVLDNVGRALANLGGVMVVSAGRDSWYKVEMKQLDIGGTLVETIAIKKIKTSGEMAAQSQGLVCEIGDAIAFVSFEPEVRLLSDIAELEGYQVTSISDPIKPDIEDADFTGGHLFKYRSRLYLSAPPDGKVFINETRQITDPATGAVALKRFWQPPQILPIQRFMVISGAIHGHSHLAPETYKLFTGTNDNANSFKAEAYLSYMDWGDRVNLKVFDEWVTEGYISANTKIKITLNYDFGGYTQQLEEEIDGTEERILFEPKTIGSLGDESFGDDSLGGGGLEDEALENPKFRSIHDIVLQDFHQLQVIFSTDTTDAFWEILAFGANIRLSQNKPVNIKV